MNKETGVNANTDIAASFNLRGMVKDFFLLEG